MIMMKGLFPVVTNSDFVFPDTIFDNFFNSFENPTEGNYRVPQVDIEDTDKAYILTTDLPGIAKEDINVSYNDDILTLTAKHEEIYPQRTQQPYVLPSVHGPQHPERWHPGSL